MSLGSNGMNIVTPRLRLRPLSLDDKHWILTLTRDPLWLKFIGCKSIFTLQDACDYIARTNAQRDEWGYGLCAVECQSTGNPLGVCGLFNRFSFRCPDLGFALLPEGRGKGVANEACQGVMAWAKQQGFDFLTAMTHPHNVASQQLLVGLGFHKHGFYADKGFDVQHLYWLKF